MRKEKRTVMLAILDGFGIGDANDLTNAVVQAKPKYFTSFWNTCPHTMLDASGLAVGLPQGQMGNSEVGHLNIGSGRVVYQDLTRITKDAETGEFYDKPVIKKLYAQAKMGRLHIIGLISNGNVHCSLEHVKAVIKGAKQAGVTQLYVHALLDGRDVAPKSASTYIKELESFMSVIGLGSIATIGGRYYGMDRDNRWERIEKAYKAMVNGIGDSDTSAIHAIESSYDNNITDEFIIPTVIDNAGTINDGDTVLFCNFRPDRARQLTKALTVDTFDDFSRIGGQKHIFMATMTKYEDSLPVEIVYTKSVLKNTLGEVLSHHGCHQLRIAETEKYAHVTYFFNGGKEEPWKLEDRILVNSPKVATYDMKPEMSAYEVCDRVIEAINKNLYDVIILNFANPDMVGHTGVFEAAKQAITAVDTCLGRIAKAIQTIHGDLLITADHGNAEVMVDHNTGGPNTAHTTNLVPFILVSDKHASCTLHRGALCDITPTILELAGIQQPSDMTGTSLLVQDK
ncbi:2,3-bisphosphoglycerate-independent phosphoglycerate mutase [Veillonella montpellierensis]|uniref:2,3-bisphosphoglycerate-independent phosphoglycerate mutase n=1 Tax=Veillonella montpellierensis TaxID=187328 RepID=UPI0023F8163B|nr:2,3-bisphosphoglycerate-independent phosphoglycerate mutase [Veillonella montpellierensis]